MPSISTFPGAHVARDQKGLSLSGVSLLGLATKYGTPLYVYDFDRIRERAREISAALQTVSSGSRAFYAVKALSHLAALKLIHSEGLGMDVVSLSPLSGLSCGAGRRGRIQREIHGQPACAQRFFLRDASRPCAGHLSQFLPPPSALAIHRAAPCG